MDVFDVSIEVLRLAEALVFASPESLDWQRLGPMLPRDLDPGVVFSALERHCAGRGVVLARAGRARPFGRRLTSACRLGVAARNRNVANAQ